MTQVAMNVKYDAVVEKYRQVMMKTYQSQNLNAQEHQLMSVVGKMQPQSLNESSLNLAYAVVSAMN